MLISLLYSLFRIMLYALLSAGIYAIVFLSPTQKQRSTLVLIIIAVFALLVLTH